MITIDRIRRLTLAVVLFLQPGFTHASQEAGAEALVGPPVGFKVSFKLDPRLTQGQYMGEHWVSSSPYTSGARAGGEITVEARVEGVGASGTWEDIPSEWTPADPDMVTVAPGQDLKVRITVKRAGQSSVKVSARGLSRNLVFKAVSSDGTIKVEISQ